jgi:hypothetical protein
MKRYKLHYADEVVGTYATRQEAAQGLLDDMDDRNDGYEPNDEDYTTPFDYDLEEEEIPSEINEIVTGFTTARDYLGGKSNMDFKISKSALSNNILSLEDVTLLVQSLNPSHVKALIAMNTLFTIAQAWNKADGFVPDFSNSNQAKWYPWFVYDTTRAGFVYATTAAAPASTDASFGSRLCFKSSNRARQFGKQFIDLWNEVLLIKD